MIDYTRKAKDWTAATQIVAVRVDDDMMCTNISKGEELMGTGNW